MERMVEEIYISYLALPLANAEVAEKGKLACIDTANNGVIVAGKAATGLIPIGLFMENLTGDGTTEVQIMFFREIRAVWWDNDSGTPVDSTDRGQLCFILDDETVTMDGTGHSNAGMVLKVDATKGVLVHADFKAW